MSLWRVDDQATRALMTAFHDVLRQQPGIAPATALRQAQLELLAANRRHYGDALPGTWAAFIAAGRSRAR